MAGRSRQAPETVHGYPRLLRFAASYPGGDVRAFPPTGKRFEVQHIHWLKLRDGRIVDHFATRDDVGMMQQLGLLPAANRPDLTPPG